ncbi:hypothetical protein [Paraburkholderia sp.]|uniref:hypothetical protein n=1 Tax=Paraburkholderia sp. TaxID=1926495 RepID=UPI002398FB3E|nr:hypothetical protein [Paraburkholderia sp.]MDE1182224.1 hypothetical protein [Paraburkholderia sp.]
MAKTKMLSPLFTAMMIAATATVTAVAPTPVRATPGEAACGMLVGRSAASGDAASGGNSGAAGASTGSGAPTAFRLRDGEPVDFIAGGATAHGTLHVFKDGSVYRAYWQPQGSVDRYVLANAGENSVRLIVTPPQGTPATDGQPGTTLAPQHVLSCPAGLTR